MQEKKNIIFFLFLFICFYSFSMESFSFVSANDNSSDKIGIKKNSKLNILRISFWSSYGTTGLLSFINSFAQLGYGYSISNDINSISTDLPGSNSTIQMLKNFAVYYPGILFGVHFITSGFSNIPVAGGFLYGTTLYMVAIAFSCIKTFNFLNFSLYSGPSNIQSIQDKLNNIYNKIFDPTSYFIVGSFSILAGIADVVIWALYNKEMKMNKFPFAERNFTMIAGPEGVTVKINL
jgi:hypothetical protein